MRKDQRKKQRVKRKNSPTSDVARSDGNMDYDISNCINDLRAISRRIGSLSTPHVNSENHKNTIRQFVKKYFEVFRIDLIRHGLDVSGIDSQMQMLLSHANSRTRVSIYKKTFSLILRGLESLESQRVLVASNRIVEIQVSGSLGVNEQDKKIIDTLSKILPAAAHSYQQVLTDLGQTRASYRGTAGELREILRETLDYLASDKGVMSSPGFKLEKDKTAPTMKQKVRFILKSRDKSATSIEVPESAATIVDESVATLTRATYNRGSASTHTTAEREEILNLKRYLDGVLCELLEIY